MTASTPLRAGEQLASAECTVRVVVVRAPAAGDLVLTCGAAPMVPAAGGRPSTAGVTDMVTLIGKRYIDENDTLEVLCTSPGIGELRYGGVPLIIKAAKALPASD